MKPANNKGVGMPRPSNSSGQTQRAAVLLAPGSTAAPVPMMLVPSSASHNSSNSNSNSSVPNSGNSANTAVAAAPAPATLAVPMALSSGNNNNNNSAAPMALSSNIPAPAPAPSLAVPLGNNTSNQHIMLLPMILPPGQMLSREMSEELARRAQQFLAEYQAKAKSAPANPNT
jgi:hypothetical protein